MRDVVLGLAHLADPSSATETVGLVPSNPSLRPADILTSAALPGRMAALDIGITSPDGAGAGGDCCDAMFRRKRRDYQRYLHELEVEEGVSYRPMVWSAFGRAHPEADAMLESMALLAARRRGLLDHKLILRRVRAGIGVALVRRAVRMVLACVPHLASEEIGVILGEAQAGAERPEPRLIVAADGSAEAARGA